MAKARSWQFWITFWFISSVLLLGWYLFLQVKNNAFKNLAHLTSVMPISRELKGEMDTVLAFADRFLQRDDRTYVFLLLLQNNWELRPGGGYIGSFGIVKIRNGSIESVEIHDTSNFDGRIPDAISVPYPMKQMLRVDWWKLRDSNYSLDFPTNAKQAELFYQMGNGEERFDGVIGLTTEVFVSLLKLTGPIELDGRTYTFENAVETLEYQVEKGYVDQGIGVGDRKSIMRRLAEEMSVRLQPLTITTKFRLADIGRQLLLSKDVQIFIQNDELQKMVLERGWGGAVDSSWSKDYLAVVDANLGAYKSDPKVKRDVSYEIDLTTDRPKATLTLRYEHTALKRDWMTKDYASYTRVFVPSGSWLQFAEGVDMDTVQYGEEFGKKYVGFIVRVPIGKEAKYVLHYSLDREIRSVDYDMKVQKQPGTGPVPYVVRVREKTGHEKEYAFDLKQDTTLGTYEQ